MGFLAVSVAVSPWHGHKVSDGGEWSLGSLGRGDPEGCGERPAARGDIGVLGEPLPWPGSQSGDSPGQSTCPGTNRVEGGRAGAVSPPSPAGGAPVLSSGGRAQRPGVGPAAEPRSARPGGRELRGPL